MTQYSTQQKKAFPFNAKIFKVERGAAIDRLGTIAVVSSTACGLALRGEMRAVERTTSAVVTHQCSYGRVLCLAGYRAVQIPVQNSLLFPLTTELRIEAARK